MRATAVRRFAVRSARTARRRRVATPRGNCCREAAAVPVRRCALRRAIAEDLVQDGLLGRTSGRRPACPGSAPRHPRVRRRADRVRLARDLGVLPPERTCRRARSCTLANTATASCSTTVTDKPASRQRRAREPTLRRRPRRGADDDRPGRCSSWFDDHRRARRTGATRQCSSRSRGRAASAPLPPVPGPVGRRRDARSHVRIRIWRLAR